ncbi:hypothetical protein EUX98_g1979 [Antrodiella citrinella]|uniref:non-specific serine/threonine protein kinase n=1 Tax=Antrodiella citrinella TaxID=2447956 RepID=A0A4S4N053_9APHY|nr:hypothetical protein EUX98_g1979 [Antrodiella citrinella]
MLLHVEHVLAVGGYSRVYVATITSSTVHAVRTTVALKKSHITKHVRNPTLRHETCVFLLLAGHPNIPKVYAWGRSQYYEYMALELLGKPVNSVLTRPERLTMRNLVALVCQMLDVIKHVHSHHIIHGDIKPSNFLFPHNMHVRHSRGLIYLIDFGLAKYYRNPTTLVLNTEGTISFLRGTQEYASINVHLHHTPTRRDDIESLAYTMVKLLRGTLPWYNTRLGSDCLRIKRAWSGHRLCSGFPSVFGDFVEYARGLGFSEQPDYTTWQERFRTSVPGFPNNDLYDHNDGDGPLVGLGVPVDLAYTPYDTSSDLEFELSYGAENSDPIPDSDDLWYSPSSWPAPTQVKDADQLGDEDRCVFDATEWIEAPPEMDNPGEDLDLRLTEVMVPRILPAMEVQ